jgi:hypothetical protein
LAADTRPLHNAQSPSGGAGAQGRSAADGPRFFFGEPDPLLSELPVYRSLGGTADERQEEYRKLFAVALGEDMLCAIRDATQRGWVPGSDKFRAEIEAITGRAAKPPRRSRPPKRTRRQGKCCTAAKSAMKAFVQNDSGSFSSLSAREFRFEMRHG